ncbi:HNH endonuclease signature motif containing protein [Periweissella fabalis]|uniref:HNH endonuclease n=1 Tax=Periweissella fabalis TaxID=1070421 RepID=A0A7X6N410_9LACO|nr:HNH endonuclease signature motif containing protein [Periweissella fabalis]MCM0598307.1 HNH endonuclease [Periweissella fabalis]NKZ24939.1 HNH endonuclease [Periweissella fabalis]
MRLTQIRADYDAKHELVNTLWTDGQHVYEFKNGEFEQKHEIKTGRYVCISTPVKSKREDKKTYNIQVHRLVYVGMTGHQLKKGEVVHHLDSNKSNNLISNLELTTRARNTSIWFRGKEEITRNQQHVELIDDEQVYIEKYGIIVHRDGSIQQAKTGNPIKIKHTGRSTTNLIIGVYDRTKGKAVGISYPRLLVETFNKNIPAGKWRALAISEDLSELYNPANYYPAVKK